MAETLITGIGPSADLEDVCGDENNRWLKVGARTLVDGANSIDIADIADRSVATSAADGLMAAADKKRLDNLFPAERPTFFLDPAGDASIDTPGTPEAPFRTVPLAIAAIAKRYGVVSQGFNLLLNPGEYDVVDDGMIQFPCVAGGYVMLQGRDPASRPIIDSNTFWGAEGGGQIVANNIHFRARDGMMVRNGARFIVVSGCTYEVRADNQYLFRVESSSSCLVYTAEPQICVNSSTGTKYLVAVLTVMNWAQLFAVNSNWVFQGIEAVNNFLQCGNYASADFRFANFDTTASAIAGSRFHISALSYVDTAGAGVNFIPGSGAGYIDASSVYN